MLHKYEPKTLDFTQVMPVGKTMGLLNQIKLRVPFEMMLSQIICYGVIRKYSVRIVYLPSK